LSKPEDQMGKNLAVTNLLAFVSVIEAMRPSTRLMNRMALEMLEHQGVVQKQLPSFARQ
jgi:hypothetical protein